MITATANDVIVKCINVYMDAVLAESAAFAHIRGGDLATVDAWVEGYIADRARAELALSSVIVSHAPATPHETICGVIHEGTLYLVVIHDRRRPGQSLTLYVTAMENIVSLPSSDF